MSRYDDYWKELNAYAEAHPYTGSAQWSMPGENNMDWSGNDEIGRWDEKVFADWHNSLTPENRAAFDEMRAGSVAANRKHFNNGALLTQLMIGGIATTAALGAGTKTLEANSIAALAAPGPITASLNGQIIPPGTILWQADVGDGEYPLVLAQNEGVSIRSVAVPATGTWTATVDIQWGEVSAY